MSTALEMMKSRQKEVRPVAKVTQVVMVEVESDLQKNDSGPTLVRERKCSLYLRPVREVISMVSCDGSLGGHQITSCRW